MVKKMPRALSASRKTIRQKKMLHQGSWMPGAAIDLKRVKQELKGRSGSSILVKHITQGITQGNLEDKLVKLGARVKKERNRLKRLIGLTFIPDSYNAKENEYRIMRKQEVINKLDIAIQSLLDERERQHYRAEHRKIMKGATEDNALMRLEGNKIVPNIGDKTPSDKSLVPTGTVVKKVMIGKRVTAKPVYNQITAARNIKDEIKKTEIKEHQRKMTVMREFEEYNKTKTQRAFEIIKRQPKKIQDEIERVFGMTEEESKFSPEDLEKLFE